MKKTYYTSSNFILLKNLFFLHLNPGMTFYDLEDDFNPPNNIINGLSGQNPTKTRYYTCS